MIDVGEFWFDDDAAERVLRFVRRYCVHVKGAKAGQPIILEPWQQDIFRNIFGWKRKDGTRRYRQVYVELGRKNGKSTIGACLALYMLLADNEGGAKVYSAAKTQQQAALVFEDAAQMVYQSKALTDRLRVRPTIKEIEGRGLKSNCTYKAISADAGAAHGLNPHCIIFDELHTQTTRDLWDALKTGMGAREQPLLFSITTAGHDRNTICWEQHEYAVAVRDKVIDDPTFLPVIYSADVDDDWTSEETWRKANPNYGISIREEFLREECEKAQRQPSYENTFRQLYLSQWTEQARRWLPMRAWDACKSERPELIGQPCYVGLDLAATRDITAMVLLFPLDDGTFWIEPFFFVPEESADERTAYDRSGFAMLSRFIEKTPGTTCDYGYVRRKLNELREQYQILEVAFDPWGATHLAQELQDQDGFDMVEFRQTIGNFAEPTKRLEELVLSNKIRHDGNPVLRWMASNVATRMDPSGNIRPDKERSGDKIDGIVAAIMALGLAGSGQAYHRFEGLAL